MRNSIKEFEPIYLKDAKRHIEWLCDKIKNSSMSAKDMPNEKKESMFSRVWTLIKKIF